MSLNKAVEAMQQTPIFAGIDPKRLRLLAMVEGDRSEGLSAPPPQVGTPAYLQQQLWLVEQATGAEKKYEDSLRTLLSQVRPQSTLRPRPCQNFQSPARRTLSAPDDWRAPNNHWKKNSTPHDLPTEPARPALKPLRARCAVSQPIQSRPIHPPIFPEMNQSFSQLTSHFPSSITLCAGPA